MAQEVFIDPPMPDIIEQWKYYYQLLEIEPGDRILDIGCHVGDPALFLYKQYPYVKEIVGVDKDKKKIEYAKDRFNENENTPINFITGDALDLPFGDNSFEKVICAETIEWIELSSKAIEEIYRVLKPGGIALIIHTDFDTQVFNTNNLKRTRNIIHEFTDMGPNGIIGRELRELCIKGGFKEIEFEVYTLINDKYDENYYSYKLSKMMKEWLESEDLIDENELKKWENELEHLSEENKYYYSINRNICVCKK